MVSQSNRDLKPSSAGGENDPTLRNHTRGSGKSTGKTWNSPPRPPLGARMAAMGTNRAALLGLSLGGEGTPGFALGCPKRGEALIPVSAAPGGFELQGAPRKC